MAETCERCHNSVDDTSRYTKHGVDKLLCPACVLDIDEYYSMTCAKCKKPAHMRGNLIEYENQMICSVCVDEIRIKEN